MGEVERPWESDDDRAQRERRDAAAASADRTVNWFFGCAIVGLTFVVMIVLIVLLF